MAKPMDDLISRQAVINLLTDSYHWDEVGAYCVDDIKAMPTAEPEIIRCGECKHNYVDGDNVRFNVCELMHNKVQSDDWYCADAERRNDG